MIGLTFSCSEKSAYKVTGLKVNHLTTPLGLEDNPVFSWHMEDSLADFFQKTYRILLASKSGDLEVGKADLWDSGVISSAKSLGISYSGNALISGKRAYWKVIIEDDKGIFYESEATWFEMGLVKPEDWKASWIAATNIVDSDPELTAAPYFHDVTALLNQGGNAIGVVLGNGWCTMGRLMMPERK